MPPRKVTKAQIAWPVSAIGLADHRRLGDLLVGDDRRLDLGGREPVAGDVDHVVDPPDHPEVAVGVHPGGVADQVASLPNFEK